MAPLANSLVALALRSLPLTSVALGSGPQRASGLWEQSWHGTDRSRSCTLFQSGVMTTFLHTCLRAQGRILPSRDMVPSGARAGAALLHLPQSEPRPDTGRADWASSHIIASSPSIPPTSLKFTCRLKAMPSSRGQRKPYAPDPALS